MHRHEKSDFAIVAVKPTNNAERSATELVERRARTKGNAGQLSTRWAQSQISVTQDVGSTTASTCRRYPRWEPYAGKPHVRLCGGRGVTRCPTANRLFAASAQVRCWQCAPKARIISGGRIHPESCRLIR